MGGHDTGRVHCQNAHVDSSLFFEVLQQERQVPS